MDFNLYEPVGTHDQKNNQDLIIVKKDLLNISVVKDQTDLISHSYDIVLNIIEKNIHTRGYKRKTKIVNIYDNKLGERQT